MKTKATYFLVFSLFALLTFSACQDEATEVNNPNEQETISSNSTLANLITNTSAHYGSADNILDGSSCFSVELPVTILINDVTIVIENEADLEELEELFDDLNNDEDILDFVFPITLIFSDYSAIVIENETQLESFINECEEDEVIECVDFVYPISFSVFNSEFNLIDTVSIDNDQALYQFFESLEANENTLIVSLNYPVTLEFASGETLEVNSNESLAEAISSAEDDCNEDEENDCEAEDVALNLVACPWDFTDSIGAYDNYQLVFNTNGDLLIPEGFAASAIGGSWSLSETDDGIVLTLSELTAFQDNLGGDWLIVECNNDRIEIVKGDTTLILEQDCVNDEDVFNCFGDFELLACATDAGEAEFNLSANTIGLIDCPESFIPSFHTTLADAEANVGVISNTDSYVSVSGQVYLRIETESGNFEVFTIYLNTEDCNLFECFQSFDAVIELCDEGNDGIEQFDLTIAFANCTPEADVISYHETESDAYDAMNPIANPQVYTNVVANQQIIYVRVEIDNEFEVFLIQLILDDCSEQSCSEADVDSFLTECIWNAVNYNGSDNLMNWNFSFEPNSQVVVIYTATQTIDAMWSSSQSSDGVVVSFSNVAGPNIQAITGEWLVVECEADRLELHRQDDILILERNCD